MATLQSSTPQFDFSRKSARLAFFDTIYHFLSKDSPMFAFFGKASPWVRRFPIASILKGNPVRIVSYEHGLTDGDSVVVSHVRGMKEMNGHGGQVQVVDTDTFEIVGVDATNFSIYTGGGVVGQILDNNPPLPTIISSEVSAAMRSSIGFKKIHSYDVAFGIDRREWVFGTVYEQYDSDLEVFSGYITDARDIYICLENAGGSPSTIKPDFRNGVKRLSDGYLWMHLYRCDVSVYEKFSFDTTVFPIVRSFYLPDEDEYDIFGYSDKGALLNVVIESGGSGYQSPSDVSLVVNGDGYGAEVVCAAVSNGVITGVEVSNPGAGYTWAEISVNSPVGSGARLKANLASLVGVGYDPVSILVPRYLLFSVPFNGNEGGKLPVGFDVRQFGIVSGLTDNGVPVRDDVVSRYHELTVKDVAGQFLVGDVLSSDFGEGIIIGVENISAGSAVLKVVESTFSFDELGFGVSTPSASGRLTDIKEPVFSFPYGDILFLQNVFPLRRDIRQTEEVKCKLRIW